MGINENNIKYSMNLKVTEMVTLIDASKGFQMMNTKRLYNFTTESRGSFRRHLCMTAGRNTRIV